MEGRNWPLKRHQSAHNTVLYSTVQYSKESHAQYMGLAQSRHMIPNPPGDSRSIVNEAREESRPDSQWAKTHFPNAQPCVTLRKRIK